MEKVLVTGAAGFIGMHLCKRLLAEGYEVVGVDNLNNYYEVQLKLDRLKELGVTEVSQEKAYHNNFRFKRLDVACREAVEQLFSEVNPPLVVHLAAQAGVRYSIENPYVYIESNIVGFTHILECCRRTGVEHLVYASSSSVYGLNSDVPYSEDTSIAHPVSLYAATKKSNELMAHVYSHLYALATTGLRFFTVYGPWGRPDMSPHLFVHSILSGKPLRIFNHGDMYRDFTYIDDIINGVMAVLEKPAAADEKWRAASHSPSSSNAPYRIYNIGHSSPVHLLEFIEEVERACGCRAERELLPMQPGDVYQTYADTQRLAEEFGYQPQTSIREGVHQFVEWFRVYYGI